MGDFGRDIDIGFPCGFVPWKYDVAGITIDDTKGINTGVLDDDCFTIGAVDNDTNTITELMRFVGAASPYVQFTQGDIRSANSLTIRPSGDTDDYFTLATVSGIPTIYGTGAYLRIGDAGTTDHSLASEDDLMVTGKLEVKGTSYIDGAVFLYNNVYLLADDKQFTLGAGYDFGMQWETADANANMLHMILPAGGATDVPVIAIGDSSIIGADLGFFNGITEPAIAIVNNSANAYVSLDAGDINGSPAGVGLYFKAATDEDINILKLSVAGTPTIIWDESDDDFNFSKGIDVGGVLTLGGTLLGGNNDLGTQASPVGKIIAENNGGIYFLDTGGTQRLEILHDGTNKFRIRNLAGGSIELYTDNASGAGNPATRLTMTGSVALSAVTWANIAAYTIGCTSFGVLGVAAQVQQAHIVDADGQLLDITTKFNTLLADLEGYGFLAAS